MAVRVWTWTALALAAGLLAACSQAANNTTAPTQTAEQAAHTPGLVGVIFKDVQTVSYNSGKATQCSILYNVYNNTGYHLYRAVTTAGDYRIEMGDLSANSKYSDDQTLTVDPVNGACGGVVAKLMQSGAHLATTTCQMEKVTEGECQAKVVGYVSVDAGTQAKLQQADQAAGQQYSNEQAQQFQQAKAQAWAQRGQFEAPVGASFYLANSASPIGMAVVLAPDFDPSKLDPATEVATSSVTFCAVDPTGGYAPAGTLTISAVTRDPYGLADWLKLKMECPGSPNQPIWIKALAIDNLLQQGTLLKSH